MANRKGNVNNNAFIDAMAVVYRDENNQWRKKVLQITTVPGIDHMKNPSVKKGVAILKSGQYKGVWKIDFHNGMYPALCQRGDKFVVYRDSNGDNVIDFDEATKDYGFFGINFHKAGDNSKLIGAWSAGCQVAQSSKDFYDVMTLAEKARSVYGNSFTYTLIDENDLEDNY